MSFLPFYIPGRKQLKIVIVGGGYAGVAALVTLLRHMPDARITIIDPRSHHLKITHLHETFRYPLQDFLIPFSILEDRFGCRHICASLSIDERTLLHWQNDKFLVVNNEIIDFDYVLIASGAPIAPASKSGNVFDLQDFMIYPGSGLLDRELAVCNASEQFISVVGGGATGIQFLFEIAHFLRRRKVECRLRLVHGQNRVLQQFPEGFSTYAQSRMDELDIDFYPNTRYQGQEVNNVVLEEKDTGRQFKLPSAMSFLFLGKKPEILLSANAFGQVMVERKPLQNIFTSGDCCIYNSSGSNTMTAQSAVRKGMLAARNMLRHSGFLKLLEPYWHRDLGYVVSLGPTDAVGWLALEGNVVGGVPALLIKEVVEAQYDLLLTGIDTYLI
ncbi:NAD(P)/FAD-dependent oxidoreductase [Nitrosovibrio tenuis]|uniref:NADH dehydrogenase n=1 Tax=Nitrosovibrio tenuis TaxID=1233 RepID=A0A1H7HI97_9PROT|nr:FAD-dependent oxidoreductase [Nitrosovibrio tenuis]SEK48660.1 NADH dehydrogenase [Nitrosovibrio tenuis]